MNWIDVTKNTPKTIDNVFGKTHKGVVVICFFTGDRDKWYCYSPYHDKSFQFYPTHWAPIP